MKSFVASSRLRENSFR